MAGAEEVVRTDADCTYSIDAPLGEVEGFYTKALTEVGWMYDGLGEGIGGMFLVFNRDSAHLEISAYRDPGDVDTRVVLSLQVRD